MFSKQHVNLISEWKSMTVGKTWQYGKNLLVKKGKQNELPSAFLNLPLFIYFQGFISNFTSMLHISLPNILISYQQQS